MPRPAYNTLTLPVYLVSVEALGQFCLLSEVGRKYEAQRTLGHINVKVQEAFILVLRFCDFARLAILVEDDHLIDPERVGEEVKEEQGEDSDKKHFKR